jgi:hypothetical protein
MKKLILITGVFLSTSLWADMDKMCFIYQSKFGDGDLSKKNIEYINYDFMTNGSSDDLIFLELNATGQWMFLDIQKKYGLLETVVDWLKK